MEDKLLRIVYTLFLGIMLALFVGVGVSTFYPGPKMPDYPTTNYSSSPTKEDQQKQREYDAQMKTYSKASETYNQNVSIITLVSSVVLLAISLVFEKRNHVIANGVLLGAVFTLLYSVGRGFASENSKLTFVAVTVAVVIAIYLGYRRFAPHEEKPARGKLLSKLKR